MKKILIMTLFAVVSLAAYSQNSVTVCVVDRSDSPTNIRNAPNGKVVYQMTDSEFCTVDIVSVKNGWWKITPEVEMWGDDEKIIPLKGSTTGYWIHKSVLGFGIAGDQTTALRTAPSNKAKLVKIRPDGELGFTPLAVKGQWVKCISYDGKYTGWIHADRICSNPLTTCP